MAVITEGRVLAFVVLILAYLLFYVYMYLGKRGRKVWVRTLPAMAAIPEAVGRCAEMGRPLYYTTGIGGGFGAGLADANQGPQVLASMSIMGYVARECVKAGVKMDAFIPLASALPLAEETLRTAFLAEGKPEEFSKDMITFISGQSPYLTATLGYFQRERPASNILMGGFYYESVVIGEAGNAIGAFQIAGTANTHQMPFLIATCDYMLLSEELYAAGASISEDPDLLGSIKGEDILKFIFVAVMSIGFILGLGNVTFLIDLLGM
ncbi:MAG: DUF6754 domain-containing protein [Candidatus Bathyarchaeia archaeon]